MGYTTLEIPEGTIEIPDEMYIRNQDIWKVRMPDSVKRIGRSCFQGCRFLEKIRISSSMEEIADRAFEGCNKLLEVSFSEDLRNIGSYAFLGCEKLRDLVLPESLEGIGTMAFGSLSNLLTVEFMGTLPNLGTKIFQNCVNLNCIYAPRIPVSALPEDMRIPAICGFTRRYLKSQVDPEEPATMDYQLYIRENASVLGELVMTFPEILSYLTEEGLLDEDKTTALLEETMENRNYTARAALMNYQNREFGCKGWESRLL